MKQTDHDRKGWVSPYKPSPKLPAQRSDTNKGHQIKTAQVVTKRQKSGR